MSHQTSVTVPLKDLDVLGRVLARMGLEVKRDGVVQVYRGPDIKGALVLETPGRVWNTQKNYGVAFVETEDGLEVKADWPAVMAHPSMQEFGRDQKVFLDAVGQRYSELLVSDRLESEGFTLETSTNDQGEIVLVGTRYR